MFWKKQPHKTIKKTSRPQKKNAQSARLLFIGDSITDVGRNREVITDLGKGYPLMVAGILKSTYPAKKFKIFNRGISGNKIADIRARWEEDCLALKPDVVTLLIGINDTWHNVNTKNFGTPLAEEAFETDYRYLLETLNSAGIKKIILMEPFVLPDPEDRKNWRVDLDPKIQIVRNLAQEFGAILVPLDGILNAEGIKYGYAYYTGKDGVHPTVAGHGVIADAWLKAVLPVLI